MLPLRKLQFSMVSWILYSYIIQFFDDKGRSSSDLWNCSGIINVFILREFKRELFFHKSYHYRIWGRWCLSGQFALQRKVCFSWRGRQWSAKTLLDFLHDRHFQLEGIQVHDGWIKLSFQGKHKRQINILRRRSTFSFVFIQGTFGSFFKWVKIGPVQEDVEIFFQTPSLKTL